MKLTRQLLLGALAVSIVALAACTTPPASSPGPVPARLTIPSPGCLEQLAQFASKVTGRKVTLGSLGSFADTDQLVLEPPGPRAADGRPIAGRTGDAEVFQLQQAPDAVCSVLHVGSGARASLGACTCTPK
jgi:hypothetical protein